MVSRSRPKITIITLTNARSDREKLWLSRALTQPLIKPNIINSPQPSKIKPITIIVLSHLNWLPRPGGKSSAWRLPRSPTMLNLRHRRRHSSTYLRINNKTKWGHLERSRKIITIWTNMCIIRRRRRCFRRFWGDWKRTTVENHLHYSTTGHPKPSEICNNCNFAKKMKVSFRPSITRQIKTIWLLKTLR